MVASEVELLVLLASVTVGEDEAVGPDGGVEDEFAVFGFPEFVRSGDGFCGDAPLELEAEELTDPVLPLAAAAPSRAASWALVMQTGLGSFGLSLMQSSRALSLSVLVVEALVVWKVRWSSNFPGNGVVTRVTRRI